MRLDVNIAGPGCDDIETATAAFMREQFDAEPDREAHSPPVQARDGTMLPAIGLLLSIPGAVLAAMQIAEKLELKRRLNRLLGRINDKADGQTSAILTIDDKTTIDLKASSADQIIIKLETAARLK